jgi:ribosome-associated protein
MSETLKISAFSPSTAVAANAEEEATSQQLALTIARAAEDRKGGDIVLLRVSGVSYLADYFAIVTGFSKVQVRAIAQVIQEQVAQDWQRQPLRVEGQAEGSWVLADYGDVIVHIMMPQEREFYNLEAFWGHAEQIEFAASNPVGE